MKYMKNISAALLSLACFSAVSAAAFADGPVAGAINGIGRAGEDIVDGAEDLINGVVNGVTAAPGADDEGDGMTDPDGTLGTEDGVTSDVESDPATDDGDAPAGETSDGDGLDSGNSDEPASDAISDTNSGNVAGSAGASNPGTGVTYGFTTVAAVLAAAGVAAATSRRKR